MPTPTPHDLYAHAHALWRSLAPDDRAAARYDSAERQLLEDQPSTHRRASNWVGSLHRYEDFWRQAGRTPRENTRSKATLSSGERNLGEWARYQRRFEEELNAYQRARLDVSPAFDWDPLEHIWRQKFADCVHFFERTGALPRLNAVDRVEFTLARWLGRQLQRLKVGKLEGERADALHRLLRLRRRS